MTGVSHHDGCPIALDALRKVTVRHHGLDGATHKGELIVHESVAEGLLEIFRKLYAAEFPIASMRPVREFGGSDDASMKANNTSAYNCRKKTGGSSWSKHSYGRAVDLNPLINPYVRGKTVLPKEGRAYLPPDPSVPGTIVGDGAVVKAFRAAGWSWGGNWRRLKDYQHFEKR